VSRATHVRVSDSLTLRVVDVVSMDDSLLESDGVVVLGFVDGRTYPLRGARAAEALMAVFPAAWEGKRMRPLRRSWALHNLVGHPLMQVLCWLGYRDAGLRVHDATIPEPAAEPVWPRR
jgi:hypothetical protein